MNTKLSALVCAFSNHTHLLDADAQSGAKTTLFSLLVIDRTQTTKPSLREAGATSYWYAVVRLGATTRNKLKR